VTSALRHFTGPRSPHGKSHEEVKNWIVMKDSKSWERGRPLMCLLRTCYDQIHAANADGDMDAESAQGFPSEGCS